jgi:hypothetical protein
MIIVNRRSYIMSDAKTDAGNGEQRKGSLEYLSGSDLMGDLVIVRGLAAIAVERRTSADQLHEKLVESTGLLPQTMKGMLKKPVRRGQEPGLHPITEHYVDSYEGLAEARRAEKRAQNAKAELTSLYVDKKITVTTLGVDPSKLVIVRDDELGTARDEASGHIGGFEVAAKEVTLYLSDGRGLYFVEVFDAEGQPQIDINFGSEDS